MARKVPKGNIDTTNGQKASGPTLINDAEVAKLLNNATLRRKFPFLATAHTRISNGQQKQGCGSCANKKKGNSVEYEAIRKSIGQMSVEKKAEFKDALGGQQVVVKYNVSKTKQVTLKF